MTDPQNPQQPPAYETPAYPSAPPAAPAYDPANAGVGYNAPVPGKTMGIVALVLAIVPVGLQLIGLILGIVALVQSKKAGVKNPQALWAIIVSSVLIVIGTIVAIVVISSLASLVGDITPQIQACIDNGGVGTVEVNGVTLTCEQILEDSGR